MKTLSRHQAASSTVVHGAGELGGKGEGLLHIDQIDLQGAHKLETHIITSAFYDRYRDNNDTFDEEITKRLRNIHLYYQDRPIGVRASEKYENDPYIPTSGMSSSYMLPNNNRSAEVRFSQFLVAIKNIYDKFTRRMLLTRDPQNTVSVLINPVPGVASKTRAGSFYYPMSSGVADSFFKHPVTLEDGLQDPRGGFARIAFGHGYGVVLDSFEVTPMATIREPLDPRLMTKSGQQFFYAIRMDPDLSISRDEMSTMSLLHRRFAPPDILGHFQDERGVVNFDRLIRGNALNYRSDLINVMEQLSGVDTDFQIEFIWNVIDGKGAFHVVQFKKLPGVNLSQVRVPAMDDNALIATDQFQGHGVCKDILHAVVINPFAYSDEMHDEVLEKLRRLNTRLAKKNQRYLLICPGRLGTTNREWGFNVEFESISSAAVIVEYGYDIKGRPTINTNASEMTGGIYGSHFLYQILGGADEAERMKRTRMFGSQGTHFLTNLYMCGILYLFVNPLRNHLSDWFFTPPDGEEGQPIYLKELDRPVTAYADLFQRKCLVAQTGPESVTLPRKSMRRRLRIINPHKVNEAFVLATNSEIRGAADKLTKHLPNCEAKVITGPTGWNTELAEKVFVLFIDEGAMPFYNRAEFKKKNPSGIVVLLTYDLRVGSAPTKEEVERICPLSREADHLFYVNDGDCPPLKVMAAAIRYAEDSHNIEFHKKARRYIFLVVDDELRWFSQFLPVLYRIIGQRAGVITARTYEDAQAKMEEHGSDVVCLITDMLFPQNGVVTPEAGRDLVTNTKAARPRIPIIIASKADQGKDLQKSALILPKGDKEAVEILDQYVHDFTGLGDFLFFRKGKPWRRVSTLSELRDAIRDADCLLLEEYAGKDYFSTWLHMHGFRNLAERLIVRHDRGKDLKNLLLSALDNEIEKVKEQEIVFLNSNRDVVERAKNVRDLVSVLKRIDSKILKDHTADDVLSMWLMRRGYPDLADLIRPIHGEGEELRSELLCTFEEYLCADE